MSAYSRGVLTMAFGHQRYLEMAKSLARSLELHSPGLMRAIITDADDPELPTWFRVIIPLNPTYGAGLRQKLHLDQYTPFAETLFIDSDCLVVRNLDEVWARLSVVPFAIPGSVTLTRGDRDRKMDVDFILDSYDLSGVPKFNSGLIYFDGSDTAQAVFNTARTLLAQHRELRFPRNDKPCDEPLFAVSMAIHGLSVVPDEGRTMRTPTGLRGALTIDVLRGRAVFQKYSEIVEPAVVHFAGQSSRWFSYTRECFRLRRGATNDRLSVKDRVHLAWLWLAATITSLRVRARAGGSFAKHRLLSKRSPRVASRVAPAQHT